MNEILFIMVLDPHSNLSWDRTLNDLSQWAKVWNLTFSVRLIVSSSPPSRQYVFYFFLIPEYSSDRYILCLIVLLHKKWKSLFSFEHLCSLCRYGSTRTFYCLALILVFLLYTFTLGLWAHHSLKKIKRMQRQKCVLI